MAGDTGDLGNLVGVGVVGLNMVESLDLELDILVGERKDVNERRFNFSDQAKERSGVNQGLAGFDEREISGSGGN